MKVQTSHAESPVRPYFLKKRYKNSKESERVKDIIFSLKLRTVCEEAVCPNKSDCWNKKHVTFIILGNSCTRNCLFCKINTSTLKAPDSLEPERIAQALKELGSEYAVITSVTRDDLYDGGAGHFTETAKQIKKISPETVVELLIPDFKNKRNSIEKIAVSGAQVIGHNIEMAESLYAGIRPRSSYSVSMNVLKTLSRMKKKNANFILKSSLMVGLGENTEEIRKTLNDLRKNGVDIAYIGQYLRPSERHWPVKKYYTLDEFKKIEEHAYKIGFRAVCSGPFVRSSYRAKEMYEKCLTAYHKLT